MLSTLIKPRACKHCKAQFMPVMRLQIVCGPMCGLERARIKREAKEKAEAKIKNSQEGAQFRARKEKLKRIPDLIKEAQRAFNAFIRERDRQAGYPCISSGRALDWSGNAVDAGHYRSTGAASHLRFNEDNCHAQSKHDNQYKAGNVVDYRINLIRRIGLERVEALEASNVPHKWERDELIAIKAEYVEKLKELKRSRG
jgi:hypothetical protein